RLSYAGQVLRVKGSQLRPERQVGQAGVELIGAASARADVEVIQLAAEALVGVGVRELSIDLNLPTLVPAIAAGAGLDAAGREARIAALAGRDAAALGGIAGGDAPLFAQLLAAAGPACRAMAVLAKLDLPAAADAERRRLADVVELLLVQAPDLVLTIDPVEHRGLEYHRGVGFTLFSRRTPERTHGELGRGGRYVSGKGEPSTGFTLYLDSLLRAVPPPARPRRLFLPAATTGAAAAAWRAKGWITVAGLHPPAPA